METIPTSEVVGVAKISSENDVRSWVKGRLTLHGFVTSLCRAVEVIGAAIHSDLDGCDDQKLGTLQSLPAPHTEQTNV